MSDISTKLTYLNTTKSQLKDQINYGLPTEKQITSSTTFREYVGSIFEAFLEALRNPDTLFTNLPKTSGSGSQITLNGTANAPMRIELGSSALEQTTYTGKNLCSSGNQTFTRYIEVAIEPIQAGTYTLSCYCTSTDTDSSKSAIIFVNSNNNEILTKTLDRGQISTSITLPSTATKMRFYASDTWVHGDGDTATFSNVMVSTNGGTYEPYVGGTASPNPSYPQDIHTISGNNSVVVEGKNLLTLDNYVLISGYDIVINNPLKEETTYVVSCVNDYPVANKGVAISFTNTTSNMTENGYFCDYTLGKDQTKSVSHLLTTAQANSKYMVVRSSETADIPKLNSMKMQLELGDTATTYTPYVSQTNPINLGEYELGTIGNYSNEFVRSDGETNLFTTDFKTTDNLTTYTKIDNNSFSYTCSGTWKGVTFVVPCENNTDYFINYKEYNPNNRGTYCEVKGGQTNTSLMARYHDYLITFNSGENTSLKITITNGTASDNTSGTITEIMLNKGTTALPYTPYEKGWYYKQGIGKVVLDGTENWEDFTIEPSGLGRAIGKGNNVYYVSNQSTILCDKLKGVQYSGSWGNTYDCIANYTNNRFIAYLNGATDLTTFTNKLASGFTCYYVLATPTYTKITGELANQLEQVYKGMLSYDGTTNISQVNNDLGFVINASGILGE